MNVVAKKSRGFTLVELLIVIFIIGVLSTVVLASISGAKKRGDDTATLAAMNELLAEQLVNYVPGQKYLDPCNPVAGSRLEDLMIQIQTHGYGDNTLVCAANSNSAGGVDSWRVSILGSEIDQGATGERYCVDSDGFLGIITGGDPGSSQPLCNG